MDPIATASSMSSSTWRRSVRRRAPASEQDEAARRLGRRAEELEEAAEALRAERDAAGAEEAALRADLEAERGAAETAASEAMRMIERLQRETAAALLEARQLRRLADARAERDRELQSRLASLSGLAGGYLSLLRAHGIDPDHEDEGQGHTVERVVGSTKAVAMAAAAAEEEQEQGQDGVVADAAAADLCGRVEALEADMAAARREVAALRTERARAVLAREMARIVRREAAAIAEIRRPGAVAVTTARNKPRFSSVLAVCKCFFSMMHTRRKKCSAARFTLGLSTAALLGLLLLLDRQVIARRRPP